MKIFEAIHERFDQFQERFAQAIRCSDWSAVCWYAALILAVVVVAVALSVVVLVLVGKILTTLLGKIFAVPLFLFVLWLSAQNEQKTPPQPPEELYECVRDATFLAIRDVSEYTTELITPPRPNAIECPDNPYIVEEGYVVYNFATKICGPIDPDQLKRDIQMTFRQKHRAHELNGFSRDLVKINGSYYCPLQVLGEPQDYGDYVQVSVVLATEKTIEVAHAHKMLNLDHIGRARGSQGATLTDDEI